MSDFGIIIKFNKDNAISKEQLANIKTAIQDEINTNEYTISIDEISEMEIQDWGDNIPFIILKEYYDDGMDEDLIEFINDNDLEEIKEIAAKLSTSFEDVEFIAEIRNW